jgi:CHAD domain-containing protein
MKRSASRDTSLLLQRQSTALKRHLPGAVKGDDRAVHQARVASRRLRESVPVLSDGLKGSKANKARRKIRRLTGALGMVRELDVALQMLDELAADRVPRAAIDELRAHVLAERQARREEMLHRLEKIDTDKLSRRLASVVTAVAEAQPAQWRQILSKRLLKRAKRVRTAVEEAGHLYVPERLHEVRIAVKKLRYGLELAADGGVRSAAPLVRRLKRIQEHLGRLQDLQVLRTHMAELQASNGTRVPHAALDSLASRLEDESRRLHGRYVAGVSVLTDLTADVRRVVVPQLAHGRRRAPLKMALPRETARRRAGKR